MFAIVVATMAFAEHCITMADDSVLSVYIFLLKSACSTVFNASLLAHGLRQ